MSAFLSCRRAALAVLAILAMISTESGGAHAEVSEVRISKGFGITYLPLYVAEADKLVEKHAKAAGLGDVKVNWLLIDGAVQVNDGMLTGVMDVASVGIPAFLTLWSRVKDTPQEVQAVAGLSGPPMYLNTVNPAVKTLADFSEKDRIAVTGVKTGLGAVVLQMIVAKQFGADQFARLDPLTVGLLHPDAYQAILSGKTEVTTHFASPPFSVLELKIPGVRRVVSSAEALGNMHLMTAFTSRKFADANPKLTAALLAAIDEANDIIAKDKPRAATSYVKTSTVKITEAEVVEMIQADEMNFMATPRGFMQIVDFMHRVGSIKKRPEDWKGLFIPAMHGRQGS